MNRANEALADATALREKIGEGFSLSGNLLLYIGIGVAVVLVVVGVVLLRKRKRWDELG
jgi:opacity protein-like surface antigen